MVPFSPLPKFPVSRNRASGLGIAAVAAVGLLVWALSHRYAGLFHDAGLYTLMALARSHPASLSADVFLKFASQDSFTLFSPWYSFLASIWGVQQASASLTLLFQAALIGAGWALARTVLPAPQALLGAAFLIAVPGDYGAGRIFTCIEPFLTPRMAAEALVLAGLAAALTERRLLAIGLTLGAALLHPLMAMAGACALICLYAGLRRPVITAALAIVSLKALALMAFLMPLGPWGRFDPVWLSWVKDRSPYLFLKFWDIDDWSRVAVTLATLVVGRAATINPGSLPDRARTLCLITLIAVASGLGLTLVGCDLLHLVRVTQLQPWRWHWLGTVVAALLLPAIVRSRWHAGVADRSTLLLLIAAWVFGANLYAGVAAAAAMLSLAGTHRLKVGEARWVFWGAVGMLAIAVMWRLATNLEFTDAYYLDPGIPLWLRRTVSFVHDGIVPMAVLALVGWLAAPAAAAPAPVARNRYVALIGCLAFAGVGCAALLPPTWAAWTAREFAPQRAAQFAAWRTLIPPGSDVFWPESPVAVWTLLDRPSYISVIQTSGLVFSRAAAMELARRAQALSAAVSPSTFMSWDSSGTGLMLSKPQLEAACKTGEFPYLVTGAELSFAPVAAVPAPGPANRLTRLYRCPSPAAGIGGLNTPAVDSR